MSMSRRAVLGSAMALPAARRAWADAEPLPLGALYPFTGLLALFGDESFRGLELAVDERNASGGLFERPIRLVKGDAVDAAAAVIEVKRLIGAERAGAVFGTFSSPLVLAASQMTELAGAPYFELGAISDPAMERGFRTLFRSCSTASQFAGLSVDAVLDTLSPSWGTDRGELRVGILYEDGLYGSTVGGFQVARCKERGLAVVERLAYASTTTDLSSAVQRLRSADATVVLHTGYQSDAVLFYRQMRQAGWQPRMVIGAGGGYALSDTAGTIGADFDGTLNVGFPPYDTNPAVAGGAREVAAAYERKYGAKPRSGHSLANYVGARLFMDALARAGGFEKDKVRDAVRAVSLPPGQTANGWGAQFDERGQNTLAAPVLAQWLGGVLRTIRPETAATAALRPKLGG